MADLSVERSDAAFTLVESIDESTTTAEARSIVKQVESLKDMLEAMGTFHAQALKYCKLEAAMMVRVVETGNVAALGSHGKRRACGEWLASLSDGERSAVIDACGERGVCVVEYYKTVAELDMIRAEAPVRCDEVISDILAELKDTGKTELSPSDFSGIPFVDDSMISAYTRKAYDALRASGAIYVGPKDGEPATGVYVSEDRTDLMDGHFEQIVARRVDNIASQIDSLRDIVLPDIRRAKRVGAQQHRDMWELEPFARAWRSVKEREGKHLASSIMKRLEDEWGVD